MLERDDFILGKLYYHCSYGLGEFPVPILEAYILDRIDADGLQFITTARLNVRRPLARLSDEDRMAVLNLLANDQELYVPNGEIGGFYTPDQAIEFLRSAIRDPAIASLV